MTESNYRPPEPELRQDAAASIAAGVLVVALIVLGYTFASEDWGGVLLAFGVIVAMVVIIRSRGRSPTP